MLYTYNPCLHTYIIYPQNGFGVVGWCLWKDKGYGSWCGGWSEAHSPECGDNCGKFHWCNASKYFLPSIINIRSYFACLTALQTLKSLKNCSPSWYNIFTTICPNFIQFRAFLADEKIFVHYLPTFLLFKSNPFAKQNLKNIEVDMYSVLFYNTWLLCL